MGNSFERIDRHCCTEEQQKRKKIMRAISSGEGKIGWLINKFADRWEYFIISWREGKYHP
jgi:hypothetical protein